ncbi:MAG: histidine kinase dimerization/phospho-acceptor domain-containing protein [Parvibaculum sp.]|nr:histidine kinase dimerization/phospho-acceptor domain-containing protein [Parvibaculum sp.]
MTGKAQDVMGQTGIPNRDTAHALTLTPLCVQVVSENKYLRHDLQSAADSGIVGPFEFQFGSRTDGIEPLLAPGLDALIVDIGAGTQTDLAFLRRVSALGPDAPVIALASSDDPQVQLLAMAAGAEDCITYEAEAPRALMLSLRRAIARHQLRDTEKVLPAPKPDVDAPKVTVVQESSDAIVILDSRGNVRFANAEAADLFGRELEDLIGKPFGLPSDIGEHEVAVMRPDGDNRFAEMRVIETRWGGMPARVAALTDITVRHMLEQTMQKATAQSLDTEKRSQHFFSNVNHDLRTPLTHIIGFAELMKNEQFGPIGLERYRDYASDIHSSGTMLLDMIEDLLGIAESESDHINITDEICNLGQLVEIAAASQRGEAIHNNVRVEVDCPQRLPGLRGDARRLRQGLFRLLAEAIHCAHRGATLKLAVREADSGITISITEVLSDSDKLAAQTRLPHLADDPFVSTENSGIARSESLALSLTRKVMELHGGTMDIKQSAVDPVTISLKFPAERMIR